MPVQLRRERLRGQMIEEIIAAARLLLEKDGHGAISVRAIARQVGVSAPAIYRYFPSLDALLSALGESVISELCGVVDSARDEPGDMALAFRTWALEHPASFRFILGLNRCGTDAAGPGGPLPGEGGGPVPRGTGGGGEGGGADARSLTARLARHSAAPSSPPAAPSSPSAAPFTSASAASSAASAATSASPSTASSASSATPASMLAWATLCGLALLELACDPIDLPEDIGWLYQTAAARLPR